MKRVIVSTVDDVKIVGNFWKGNTTAVLLIHMMPATKESYNKYAESLHSLGYSVFAIDLRGHGESVNGRDYKTFSDGDHQSSIHDITAAVKFLHNAGAENVFLVGASIGANLALQYQSLHTEIKKTVLLSPGTNYRGLLAIPYASKLNYDQETFIVAGSLDGRSDSMARDIALAIPGKQTMRILPTAAHGTNLLNEDSSLVEEILEWFA